MDPLLFAGAAAVAAAIIGICFMLRALGFFQYLGGKHSSPKSASPKHVLEKRLLDLNDPSRPYRIERGTVSDLLAEWKLEDAEWYGAFSKNRLERTYRAFLLLDEPRHTVRCYEESGSVSWSVGLDGITPRIRYSRSFFGGRYFYNKERAKTWGLRQTVPQEPGTIFGYFFDINEIRGPIITIVEDSGWEWVPVTGKTECDLCIAATIEAPLLTGSQIHI